MNIFGMAAENMPDLERRYQELFSEEESRAHAALAQFASMVRERGKASVNFRPTKLLGFLRSGVYKNGYEVAAEQASQTGQSVDDYLRRTFTPKYYEKRCYFDNVFEGRAFYYAALHIGGLGAKKFGDYCAVLSSGFLSEVEPIAYIGSNSLKHRPYWGDSPQAVLLIDALRADLAVTASRHQLASIKHGRLVPETDAKEWPGLLFMNDDYIEMIITKPFMPEQVEVIKFSKRQIMKANLDYFENRRSSTAAPVADHNEILLLLGNRIAHEDIDMYFEEAAAS